MLQIRHSSTVVDELSGAGRSRRLLLFEVRPYVCALPVGQVVETMRPLPVKPWPEAPEHVLGVSRIRGLPTPVVDAGSLLDTDGGDPTRFVILRVADRQVALAVGSVLGVEEVREDLLQPVPPLVQHPRSGAIAAIAIADSGLWLVLEQLRLVTGVIDALSARDQRA